IHQYVLHHEPEPKQAPLAGNTIGTDLALLSKHMPPIHQHLHYRNIDVATIKELTRLWYPRIYFNAPDKDRNHRALNDIHESIRELQYYRRTAFVDDPGPTTIDARLAATQVMADFPVR